MPSNKAKKSIRDKALEQVRKTRAEMAKDHPQLFKALRLLVAQSQEAQKPQEQARSADTSKEETVAIDRQKNLEAVIKYAALNPGSEKLRAQLKEFIN
ncbi:MAG: hypothetical protein JKY71_04965 [Alphaproteobacteria bacterium]|mgnify:CR=1 FL=1|nr:hypothetical protein [Alphaproteobacteria bacterium]